MSRDDDDKPVLQPLTEAQREELSAAVASYEDSLSDRAIEYLDNRGIDLGAALGFRLGEVVKPAPGHERFRGMLAIPYLDRNDQPLTVRFRCLETHNHRENGHGKYMSVPHDPARMFNVRAVHQSTGDTLDCAEGELDCIALDMLGLDAVAIPGANAWRPYHRRMLAGFSVVRVWADRDANGAGDNLLAKITQSMRQARPVRLPSMGDVGENLLLHGGDALLDLVREKGQ